MRQVAPTLLGLTMFICACGGEQRVATDSASGMADSAMAGATTNMPTNMMPNVPTDMMPNMMPSMMLVPMNNSGAMADVTLSAVGAQSSVAVNVTGAAAYAKLPAHVHSGSCEAPGPVVAALDSLVTDANGHAMSSTMLNLPMSTLADGRHFIQVHAPNGQPAACGNVNMQGK